MLYDVNFFTVVLGYYLFVEENLLWFQPTRHVQPYTLPVVEEQKPILVHLFFRYQPVQIHPEMVAFTRFTP